MLSSFKIKKQFKIKKEKLNNLTANNTKKQENNQSGKTRKFFVFGRKQNEKKLNDVKKNFDEEITSHKNEIGEQANNDKKFEEKQVNPKNNLKDNNKNGETLLSQKEIDDLPSNVEIGLQLKDVPFLARLSVAKRNKIGGAFHVRHYLPNETIIKQGDIGTEFFIITAGNARITFRDQNNNDHLVEILSKGDYFGETALVTKERRNATVTAVSELTLLELEARVFRSLFTKSFMNIQFGRRQAVCAEEQTTSEVDLDSECHRLVPRNANRIKSRQSASLIKETLKQHIFFRNIDDRYLNEIVLQMQSVNVASGKEIVRQGDKGEFFYVIENGEFAVYIQDNEISNQRDKVTVHAKGSCFGELALMYNSPRSATVVCESDEGLLWVIDRYTFRQMLTNVATQKLVDNENFLRQVSILNVLDSNQIEKLAEALDEHIFYRGAKIIKQGENGDNFYIIKNGEVDVSRKEENGIVDNYLKTLTKGDYFGERALLTSDFRTATITAKSETVECLVLNRTSFDRLLGSLKSLLQQKTETSEINSQMLDLEISKSMNENSYLKSPNEYDDKIKLLSKNGDEDENGVLKTEKSKNILNIVKNKKKSLNSEEGEKNLYDNMKYEDLKIIDILGCGAFGLVRLVTLLQNENLKKKFLENDKGKQQNSLKSWALKSVSKQLIVSKGQKEHIRNERAILVQLSKSEYFIRLYRTFNTSDYIHFLLEPALAGELFTLLRDRRNFKESTARFYAACVVLAFEYLHSRNIIYRDLKPENLMLTKSGYLKLTDFGFAKVVKNRTFTLCGTPDYLAPEMVSGLPHGKGVDQQTLGILCYEMMASYPPFYASDQMKTYKKIIRGKIKFPGHFSRNSIDFIRCLTNIKPTKRLGVTIGGASAVKKHPQFNGFNQSLLERRQMKAPIEINVKNCCDTSNFDSSSIDDSHLNQVKGGYVSDGTDQDKDF